MDGHLCLFPMLTNGGPIYGFDIIAGEKKVRCFTILVLYYKKTYINKMVYRRK